MILEKKTTRRCIRSQRKDKIKKILRTDKNTTKPDNIALNHLTLEILSHTPINTTHVEAFTMFCLTRLFRFNFYAPKATNNQHGYLSLFFLAVLCASSSKSRLFTLVVGIVLVGQNYKWKQYFHACGVKNLIFSPQIRLEDGVLLTL